MTPNWLWLLMNDFVFGYELMLYYSSYRQKINPMFSFFPFSTNISNFEINIIHRKLVFCKRKTFVVSGLKHFLFLRMTPTVLFLTRMMSSSIGRYPGTFILSILSRKLKRRKNVIAINKSLFSRVSNSTITNVCLLVC